MGFFEYFPFDHAVQINYDANGNETSRETKTSGKVKYGYERYTGSYPHYHATEVPSYTIELWFRIPSDAYKYWYVERFFWYKEFGVGYEDNYTQYYYYVDYWTTEVLPREGTIVTTGSMSYNAYNEDLFVTAYSKPSNHSIGAGRTNEIKLDESEINWIQANGDEYIVITFFRPSSGFQQRDEKYFYWYTQLHEIDLDTLNFGTTATPVLLNVAPVYPVNVYVRDDKDLIVDWEFSNNINRSATYLYQASNEVVITDKNGDSITEGISGSTESQVTFDAEDLDTLAVGKCTVVITVTSNYGTTGTATCEFELTGETNAPEITSVTQNSCPTITWTSENQIAWELQISNVDGIVYKTSMVAGDDTSFTVPQLLEDGGYSLEMRCMNEYGILTAWSSYFLDLEPTKPDAPENIVVSARADFGISINCDAMETTGKLLAVRRKDSDSEPEVLGEYNGSFVDYLVGLDDPYEYTIRNYEEGYADGEWIDGTLAYNGVVIRDAQDYSRFIHVWKSEDISLNYIHNDDRSDTLIQCVGRKFPVSELGEWLTTTRSFSGYVSDEDFKKLKKMKIESTHVLLQSKEEYFPCHMEFSDQGEYINDGRLVNFQMTRIDGDK